MIHIYQLSHHYNILHTKLLTKLRTTFTLITNEKDIAYAEIGASFNNSCFGLLLWVGCFCCFDFECGCTQNIVSSSPEV